MSVLASARERLHSAAGRSRHAPAPCIVGVPRSGTTLLRLMLDAHPQLAIPPETGFGEVLDSLVARAAGPDELLDAIRALATWPDLAFDEAALRARLAAVRPWSLGDGLRTIFAAYAERHGKPRWGDKTPSHSRHMTVLASELPELRFVHIVRDGRDVALSVRGLPIAPAGIEAIARDWRDRIETARRQGARVRHYREVCYERLVADPETELRALCDYLRLDFDPAMLQAHEHAAARHREMPERLLADGTWITHEERNRWHALTLRPPDPARAGRWREALDPADVTAFEAVAGPLLAELGYPLAGAGS
ncbi:MAG TPA: sulfotransferase [Conexibacter sp.]|nr:sulfotransferase [Conexibacter sp.]